MLNGGTLEINSPRPYGPVAAGLLRTLGIDVAALAKRVEHRDFYEQRGLHNAVFFDAETFERQIREQLDRTLSAGGFDAARDITAITVNRWPHGYAPEYNPLFDADVPEAQRPQIIGRARFGRIAIANSDCGGGAYTDIAINQGHRAVMELQSRLCRAIVTAN